VQQVAQELVGQQSVVEARQEGGGPRVEQAGRHMSDFAATDLNSKATLAWDLIKPISNFAFNSAET
jgi:hypothetical protein